MAVYIAALPDLEAEQFDAVNALAAAEAKAQLADGRRRHYASAPAVRMCGPHSRAAVRAGINHTSLLRTGKRKQSVDEVLAIIEAPE